MRRRLAAWAFRRLVVPYVRGYLCHNKVTGEHVVFTPDEITVVLAGGRLSRVGQR